MDSQEKITALTTFLDALRSPSLPARTVLVNKAALCRNAQAGLTAAERLRGYGNFLEHSRSTKAKSRGALRNLDREVSVQAQRALEDVKSLTVSTLRTVRNMDQGGVLAGVMDTFRGALQRSGAVAVADIWENVTGSAKNRDLLLRAGISAPMCDTFDATVRAVDLHLSADSSSVIIAGSANGAPVKAAMTITPRSAPSRVTDLLFRGRFDELADAFERGNAAYLSGLALPDNEPRPEEIALAGVLASYHDTVRHIRKLQDIGLASYRGAGATTILLIVAAALMIAGTIVSYEECPAFTVLTEGGSGDSLGCGIAKILFSLGMLFFLFIVAGKNAPPQTNNMNLIGSPVVHGVVRDFVLRS